MRPRLRPYLFSATLLLTACGGGGGGGNTPTAPGQLSATLSPVAELGRQIFHDPSLSASGKQACASCHRAEFAFSGAGLGQIGTADGGPALNVPGFRKAPSLRYLRYNPAFYFASDGTPTGGLGRDGGADSFFSQARTPLLAAHEMANASVDDVITKLQSTAYAATFRQQFGANIFSTPELAFERLTYALQQYQREDADFAPFSSKYDAFLAGKTRLSDAELRGLALFNDANKGNCAACHPSSKSADGTPPLFTDFSFDNLGVPRNPRIAANADPAYYDMGLCGPFRKDLATRTDLCGAFKVPTLRNVALGGPYFHNGRFATLKEALHFYVQRDTNPELWYPQRADGSLDIYNDLPEAYRGNVNRSEVPYNRHLGDAPALNDTEIDDLIAFLGTLTDGYTP